MAKLTSKERKKLPDSAFAVVKMVKDPETGKMKKYRGYPVMDKGHAMAAKARLNQGKNITAKDKKKIVKKANKKIYGKTMKNKNDMNYDEFMDYMKKNGK